MYFGSAFLVAGQEYTCSRCEARLRTDDRAHVLNVNCFSALPHALVCAQCAARIESVVGADALDMTRVCLVRDGSADGQERERGRFKRRAA